MWRFIATGWKSFDKFMSKEVGNGVKTRFWLDEWRENKPMCSGFPNMFEIAVNKQANIADYVTAVNNR